MPGTEAVSTAAQPVVASAEGANAAAQAAPSGDAKPELFDLSPLGDNFKDIKVAKAIADKLPDILKSQHFTPELVDCLTDTQKAALYFQSESGYRKAHAERFDAHAKSMKELDTKAKTLAEKERAILDKEKELAEVEGDTYFGRDSRVKEKTREARKRAAELGLEGESAEAYVNDITKPYMDLAKAEYQARLEAEKKQLAEVMETNSRVGKEVFPEFDPSLAAQLLDGFVINGSDPKSAADLFRKELDRVIEYEKAKAVADYVKKVNEKQPDAPTTLGAKPVPSGAQTNEYAESVERGKTIFSGLFGK